MYEKVLIYEYQMVLFKFKRKLTNSINPLGWIKKCILKRQSLHIVLYFLFIPNLTSSQLLAGEKSLRANNKVLYCILYYNKMFSFFHF